MPISGRIRLGELFQFTPLREGRRIMPTGENKDGEFQFTPLREGRLQNRRKNVICLLFQFTPLREGRHSPALRKWMRVRISIHAPPRGATQNRRNGLYASDYFNSRPSARGDIFPSRDSRPAIIFQFTPLREGRHAGNRREVSQGLFQFTPLREGRLPLPAMPPISCYFNSRPSARGDNSIHEAGVQEFRFQFTPLREGRRTTKRYFPQDKIFQFTPLREGRRGAWVKCTNPKCDFNSRPSARGDAISSAISENILISIHAPPRGATRCGQECLGGLSISIHAPPRGATRATGKPDVLLDHFNSRPSARGDGCDAGNGNARVYFNSRPSARGDAALARRQRISETYFNSRPSARGDICGARLALSNSFQFTPLREGRQAAERNAGRSKIFQFTPLREGRRRCSTI